MQEKMMRVIVVLGMLGILVILEMIREYHTFRVTDYIIESEKLQGLAEEKKIVFLSDLHNRVYGKENSRLIEKIKAAKPDLILIGGDMLVGKPEVPWDIAYDLVRQLPDIAPVYYANGNHEFRMKIYPDKYGSAFAQYQECLMKCGVQFLENEAASLWLDQCALQIWGLEVPKYFYSKFRKQHMESIDVERCLGKADSDKYQILLAHNPSYVKAYKEWGADLILCGHLHGGVVRIPGIGGVVSTQLQIFPKYSGELTKEGNTHIVVSKGIGSHSVNLRLLNLPEIVVLHLKACEKTKTPV